MPPPLTFFPTRTDHLFHDHVSFRDHKMPHPWHAALDGVDRTLTRRRLRNTRFRWMTNPFRVAISGDGVRTTDLLVCLPNTSFGYGLITARPGLALRQALRLRPFGWLFHRDHSYAPRGKLLSLLFEQ
jgi:hypothetical protein